MLIIKQFARIYYPKIRRSPIACRQNRKWFSTENPSHNNPSKVSLADESTPAVITNANSLTAATMHFEPDDNIVHHQDLGIDWKEEMRALVREEEEASPLKTIENTMSINIAPSLRPTFNLAAYVNKSTTLQEMIRMGVDLSQIEKKRTAAAYVLELDFNRDMKKHIRFFTQFVGVDPDRLGWMITKNPFIFKEDLDNLETRCNYLLSKRFDQRQVIRIVEKNPFWLMFSTKRIDYRLGHFQCEYELTGDEVRTIAEKKPTVITHSFDHLRDLTFMMREEFNLEKHEFKELLLKEPKILIRNRPIVMQRFDFAMREMKLTNSDIVKYPEILLTRLARLQQRHGFLKSLGKAQYDPKLDLFVSPREMVCCNDIDFALNIAKSTPRKFDAYLRTM